MPLPLFAIAQQCLHVGSFDIATTAGALSQLAGVLAGFAFFAVIFILTNTSAIERLLLDRGDADYDEALLTLFCATFGLAITAVQYAILAGERTAGLHYGRAASEELMADISLSLSIFMLVAGMLLLIVPTFGRTERTMRLLASIGGPPIAVYFVAETCREVAVGAWAGAAGLTICGHNDFYSAVQLWAHTVAPILVFAVALAIWLVPRYLPARILRGLEDLANRGRTVVPVATLLAVVAAVSIGVSFDEFHPHSHIAKGWLWIAISGTALITLVQAYLMRFYKKAP